MTQTYSESTFTLKLNTHAVIGPSTDESTGADLVLRIQLPRKTFKYEMNDESFSTYT